MSKTFLPNCQHIYFACVNYFTKEVGFWMALHIWRLITLAQLSYKLACTLFHFRIHTVLLLCRGNIWFYQPSVHSSQKAFTHIFFFRSTGQTVKRQTENLHVDYYVTRDFKSEYKGSALQQIEKNVEEDYVSNVRNNCWKERQTSEYQLPHHIRSIFHSAPNCFKLHCFFFSPVSPRNRLAVRCKGLQGWPNAQEGGAHDDG